MLCMKCGRDLGDSPNRCTNCGAFFGSRNQLSSVSAGARTESLPRPNLDFGSSCMAWDVLVTPTAAFEDIPARQSWIWIILILLVVQLPGPITISGMSKDKIASLGFSYGTSAWEASCYVYLGSFFYQCVNLILSWLFIRFCRFQITIRHWVSTVALVSMPFLICIPAAALVAFYGVPETSLSLNFKQQVYSFLLFELILVISIIWMLVLFYKGLRVSIGCSFVFAIFYLLLNAASFTGLSYLFYEIFK